MAPAKDNTTRFSSRVDDYVSYRPSYPAEIVKNLVAYFNLRSGSTIVDIGSGTGISSALILEQLESKETKVIGVEPNKEMREAGDHQLSKYVQEGRFSSIEGTAEATGLEDNSVDLIIAAQAFHWFDVPKAREECKRVLKKSGKSGVALIWNARRGMDSKPGDDQDMFACDLPVMTAYDLLLVRRSKDYEKVSHHKTTTEDSLKQFFGPLGFEIANYENPYNLSYDQLKGRLLSSSYTPLPGEEGYQKMMEELQELFDKYQVAGKVNFVYDTRVFYGCIS